MENKNISNACIEAIELIDDLIEFVFKYRHLLNKIQFVSICSTLADVKYDICKLLYEAD